MILFFVLAIPLGAYLVTFFNKKPFLQLMLQQKRKLLKSKLFLSLLVASCYFMVLEWQEVVTSGHMMSGIMQGSKRVCICYGCFCSDDSYSNSFKRN